MGELTLKKDIDLYKLSFSSEFMEKTRKIQE